MLCVPQEHWLVFSALKLEQTYSSTFLDDAYSESAGDVQSTAGTVAAYTGDAHIHESGDDCDGANSIQLHVSGEGCYEVRRQL